MYISCKQIVPTICCAAKDVGLNGKDGASVALMAVASGKQHTLLLDNLGVVWGCGDNKNGELGEIEGTRIKQFHFVRTPTKFENLPHIISVSAGASFSLFLDANGGVWSCGLNTCGQLGLGDKVSRCVVTEIPNLPSIASICATGSSSIFLDCEGFVWTCGWNQYGQLGLGDTELRTVPEKIKSPSEKEIEINIISDAETAKIEAESNEDEAEDAGIFPRMQAIAGGYYHALFLDEDGSVWSCGYNQNGNLGLGHRENKSTPEKIPELPKITTIAGGQHFTLLLDEDGYVWVCGSNSNGELGLGHTRQINKPEKNNNLSRIVAFAGAETDSIFLDDEGSVFTSGSNETGQLGFGNSLPSKNKPEKVPNIPPISYISTCNASHFFSHLVDRDGGVWACGENFSGQLGLPTLMATSSDIFLPVENLTCNRVVVRRGKGTKSARNNLSNDNFDE